MWGAATTISNRINIGGRLLTHVGGDEIGDRWERESRQGSGGQKGEVGGDVYMSYSSQRTPPPVARTLGGRDHALPIPPQSTR